MKIMTQWEAAKAGLTKYFGPTPCKRGHGSERYTTTGQCVECTKIRAKKRQEAIKALRDVSRGQ